MKTETEGNAESTKERILAGLVKKVAQPYVDKFSDVFEDYKPYDVMKGNGKHPFQPRYIVGQNVAGNLYNNVKAVMQDRPTQKHPDESMKVGPFCSVHSDNGNQYFSVSCADWVVSRIRERTIIIGGDTMSFELCDHKNGWTLVTAHHGQIIGSVWLAYIKTDSIPKGSA